jgi:hypothetical protein
MALLVAIMIGKPDSVNAARGWQQMIGARQSRGGGSKRSYCWAADRLD